MITECQGQETFCGQRRSVPIAVEDGAATKKVRPADIEKMNRESWMIVFTAALALVGALQLIAFALQARRLRQTIGVMHDTAERQLRAYVNVRGGKVLNVNTPDARVVQVAVQNFGQTPAHSVRFWLGVGLREVPLKSSLGVPPASLPLASDVLAPGLPSTMEVSVPALSLWEEDQLQQGTGAIYAFGQVRYIDIFNQERITHIQLRCGGKNLDRGLMSADVEGNSAT
jgi:hypothetical protein